VIFWPSRYIAVAECEIVLNFYSTNISRFLRVKWLKNNRELFNLKFKILIKRNLKKLVVNSAVSSCQQMIDIIQAKIILWRFAKGHLRQRPENPSFRFSCFHESEHR